MKKIALLYCMLIMLPMYTMDKTKQLYLRDEGVLFKHPSSDVNLRDTRKKLEQVEILEPEKACAIDPRIIMYPLVMPERPGVCYDFAMNEILKKYNIQRNFKIIGCEDWQHQLGFFKHVKNCKKDDLVIYLETRDPRENEDTKIVHFGLVVNPQTKRVKGKWGTVKALYEHDMFCLPLKWGMSAVIMRLKKPYRTAGEEQNKFINHIKETMENTLEVKQLLFNCEHRLLNLVLAGQKYNIIQLLEQVPQLSINYRNHLNQTLLMIAVQKNNFHIVKLLLDYGANKNLKDMYGKTALDIAKSNNNVEIQKLLS